MKIGNINIDHNIFLAPMAGICDYTFRSICESYGAGCVYSEMVSAKGLYYKDKKTASLMEGKHSVPYGVQIFGSEPEIIGEIAAEAASYGDFLDINMGCPTPKIVNNGDGSALLKNPELAGKVIKAAVDNAGKPVTVKMRIGWDEKGIGTEFARMAEANGAAAITVHGRTRAQFYSGAADWDEIGRIVRAVKIPVIGNGDVTTPELAKKMFTETGCAAVMVGRGSEGNPFIFRQMREVFEKGNTGCFPTEQEKIKQALEHTRLLVEQKGEARGIKEARKHLAWYIKGMKNSSELKTAIFKTSKYNETKDLLSDFCDSLYK